MASVVRRPNGWEIRESVSTESGPRSRTLATFKRLDEARIERARFRASRDFDRAAVINAALRAGAPVDGAPADEHAEALIRALERGGTPRPALRRLLAGHLRNEPDPTEATTGAAAWLGASAEERGTALIDLLLLADAIPSRRRSSDLSFPGFGRG
jgi:hypothetical protein